VTRRDLKFTPLSPPRPILVELHTPNKFTTAIEHATRRLLQAREAWAIATLAAHTRIQHPITHAKLRRYDIALGVTNTGRPGYSETTCTLYRKGKRLGPPRIEHVSHIGVPLTKEMP